MRLQREYSQSLTSYWSHWRNTLRAWHPIGHTEGIFSEPDILLVTLEEYSQSLTSYWSHIKEYSQSLTSYWSHWRNILRAWHPIGHT
jgi:hypothetical protein